MTRVLASILIVFSLAGYSQSQEYAVTQYQGFRGASENFATTLPNAIDANLPGVTDQSGMSPDSWSQPTASIPPAPAQFAQPNILSQSPNELEAVLNQISPVVMSGQYQAFSGSQPLGENLGSAIDGAEQTGQKSDSPFRSASFGTTPKANLDETPVGQMLNGEMPTGIQNGFGGAAPTRQSYSVYPLYQNSGAQAGATVVQPGPIPAPPHLQQIPQPVPNVGGPQYSTVQPAGSHLMAPNSMGQFRPDLGQRSPTPTVRNFGSYDDGKKYDFEDKKKEYPPMSEILATGRYFGSASMMFIRPHFQDNTAFTSNSATFGESIPFDFDFEVAPFLRFGFESKYGPGIEFDYFQFDEASNVASFTATGGTTAEISTWMMGPNRWSRLEALNAGEVLTAEHAIDVETFGVSFFKEVQLPISRINGRFGFQYISVAHTLDATLTAVGGGVTTLQTRSDMRAYGPKFTLEYYRPVGHTKLEFITTVGGSVLFGQRDQFVENTQAADFSRVGADEFITNVNFTSGVQYKHNIAEKRAVFARLGVVYSTWIGGGSALDPQGDFGLRGFSFGVGYNR